MTWIKSTRSGGNGCVEVTSSFCSSGSCVEADHVEGFILVRDTKDRSKEPIAVPVSSWVSTILAPIQVGRLPSTVAETASGFEWWGHTVAGHETFHRFTPEEWEKFTLGVIAGEFELERLTA